MNNTPTTFLKLGNQDWDAVARGLMIVIIAGALTYLTPTIAQLAKINIPPIYYPYIMGLWSGIVNYFRKLADGKTE